MVEVKEEEEGEGKEDCVEVSLEQVEDSTEEEASWAMVVMRAEDMKAMEMGVVRTTDSDIICRQVSLYELPEAH